MAILLTGKAVILQAHQGRQHVVSQLRPGDMLGEISLVGGKTRFASYVTAAPSDFAVLTTDRLKQMLDDQPRMGHQFLLMLRGLTTLRQRIAATLTRPRPLDEPT
jgi:CRP-like cAMP-binding protein